MARFLEFLVDHWILSGLWLALFATLLAYLNAKSGAKVSPQQATMLVNKEDGLILDVRERKDFEKGHIVDATNIPLAKLTERAVELEKYKTLPVIIVCQMGQQSSVAIKTLTDKGFTRLYKMAGGMTEWQAQSLPLVK